MPAPGWWLGSRGTRDVGGDNPMGGMNLGGVQTPFSAPSSSVSSPDAGAGVSGTPAGQPSPPSSDQGSTPAGSTPAGNANVTGFNGPLALAGFNNSVGRALPGVGSMIGGFGGMAADLAAGVAKGQAANALPSDMTTSNRPEGLNGLPVNYAPPPFFSLKNLVQTLTGLPMGSLSEPGTSAVNMDPETGTMGQVETPSVSPNMGFGVGVPGSTSLGPSGDSSQPAGSEGGRMAGTAPTGPPNTQSTNFGERGPDFSGREDLSESPTTATPDTAGPTPTQGDPTGQDSGTGNGPAAGVSGDTSGDAGSGMRRGGPVKRPSPKMLADKLKAGAKVPVGSKKPGADDVPVRLSRGEEVVNKNATDQFGPILDQMNKLGNRAGGMGVGRRQA